MSIAAYRPGQFVFRDLFTTDVAASQRFYSEVFGWKLDTVTYPGGDDHYTMLKAGEHTIGGLMKVPMPGMPPFWTPYVSVDDVDATAARVTAAGGRVLHGPEDVPNVGRYVLFKDPQGAAIHAWRHVSGDPPRSPQPGVGEFCWEQLNTTDPVAAAAFYTAVFGWTATPAMIDPRITGFNAGSIQVASSMQAPPEVPAHWMSYVVVETLAATFARVKQQGGSVMVESIPVTGLGTLGVIQDNVGAVIGIFEAKTA